MMRRMRVLFTVQPAAGHLHPLVPVARALSDAGHDVAVASGASFRPEVESFGLEHLDAGLDWLMADRSTYGEFPPMPPPGPEFPPWVVLTLADITTRSMVPDLLAVAEKWKPDLIIREGMEYGGCIAAEVLGIPHASVAGNAYAALDSPDINYFPGNRLMVAEPLARHRDQFGLPPDPDVEMPFRHLHMCFTPPAWDGASAPRPRNTRFLRHTSTVSPGARLPEWVESLPDRPSVFASLGTVFNKTAGVLEAIVEALAEEPVNAIVSIGRDVDPGRFGRLPDHVRLEAYVPQSLLLSHCAAFITHGGFNSVKEALGARASRWSWCLSAPTSPIAPNAAPTSASRELSAPRSAAPRPSATRCERCSPSRATARTRAPSRRRCWRCRDPSKWSSCSRG
jgi:UDP:flavonoid glycosyltransferase YjiC (YdhE family)